MVVSEDVVHVVPHVQEKVIDAGMVALQWIESPILVRLLMLTGVTLAYLIFTVLLVLSIYRHTKQLGYAHMAFAFLLTCGVFIQIIGLNFLISDGVKRDTYASALERAISDERTQRETECKFKMENAMRLLTSPPVVESETALQVQMRIGSNPEFASRVLARHPVSFDAVFHQIDLPSFMQSAQISQDVDVPLVDVLIFRDGGVEFIPAANLSFDRQRYLARSLLVTMDYRGRLSKLYANGMSHVTGKSVIPDRVEFEKDRIIHAALTLQEHYRRDSFSSRVSRFTVPGEIGVAFVESRVAPKKKQRRRS